MTEAEKLQEEYRILCEEYEKTFTEACEAVRYFDFEKAGEKKTALKDILRRQEALLKRSENLLKEE